MIKSKFGWRTTADQVGEGVDLSGKTVIVTGANTGIGLDTARVLAAAGAYVILGRDMSKGERAVETIKKTAKDLSSFASVRAFVEEFKKRDIPLNILVNNAGLMSPPFTLTSDGYELQFATNHLGPFLLTTLLLPELQRGAPARVINVSSSLHGTCINWDNINSEKGYGKITGYAQSKTANILFSNELNRRYKENGIFSNALHPGAVETELQRHQSSFFEYYSIRFYIWLGLFKNTNQGAATTVFCATAPELEGIGGRYFADSNEQQPWKHALNQESATRLWELSEKFVGHKAETL